MRVVALAALALSALACGGEAIDAEDSRAGSGADGGTGDAGAVVRDGGPRVGSPAGPSIPCGDPEPLGYGLFRCSTGFFHRQVVEACEVVPASELAGGCSPDSYCLTEGDCARLAELPLCAAAPGGSTCYCYDDCRIVGGCGSQICIGCGSPGQVDCFRADCHSDADCAPGRKCISYVTRPAPGGNVPPRPDPVSNLGFSCQRAEDECAGDGDCAVGRCLVGRGAGRQCVDYSGPLAAFPW